MRILTPKTPVNSQASSPATPETLRRLIPLEELGRASLTHLADHAEVMELGRGETLFSIGDRSPYTYYLLEGTLSLTNRSGECLVVRSGTEQARYAVGNLLPRNVQVESASRRSVVVRFERDLLSKEVTWGRVQGASNPKSGSASKAPAPEPEWRQRILRTPVFARLPMANVQRLFERLRELPVKAGEVVIREGAAGDYFYILLQGSCRVIRRAGEREILLNRLKPSDAFGDEALVSDRPRRATVTMETDGLLLRLSKEDFQELMQAPLLKHVALPAAYALMSDEQALLIDVRMEEEFAQNRLKRALNIPLFLLYLKAQSMNRKLRYILYCDTGSRSEAAAFLLTREGFEAYVLENPGEHLNEASA